jgi:hypothetical protein
MKAEGAPPPAVCFAFACFAKWCGGGGEVDDPKKEELVALAGGVEGAEGMGKFLALFVGGGDGVGEWLAEDCYNSFVGLAEGGVRESCDALTGGK